MQAYPFQHKDPTTGLTTISDGMTLRDYFAAQAMNKIIGSGPWTPEEVSTAAYKIADAMLEARNVNN